MNLYNQMLAKILEEEEIHILFPNVRIDPKEIVELECYKVLQEIKTIIEDTSIEDEECFLKIEEIICLFEGLGSDGGSRHDFG